MKKTAILSLLAASALSASAGTTVDLQGTVFQVDTVAHYYIGPGMTHTQLNMLAGSRRVQVFAVTLDKADPSYSPAATPRVEIGNDQVRIGESVSSMAKRKNSDTRRYIAGINGDFFITSAFANQHEFGNEILGYPNMSCVVDGMIAAPDMIDITSRENALIIGSDGMWIDATDLTYKILNSDGSKQVKAKAVNYPRREGEIMVYNPYMGPSTRTAAGGREIALRLAEDAQWRTNASVKFTVVGDWSTDGNMLIPSDGIVISAGPTYSDEFIDGLKEGDVVKIKIILSLPAFEGIKPDVMHVVGGDVRILNSDKVTTEAIRWINTPSSPYPRSLTGYSQDRSKLVMAAVDGGKTTSNGLSYYESADLMRFLGCYDALDLDGGGSTVLYTDHAGITNNPRDGSERAVGNALYFVLDGEGVADNTVASIRFADHARTLPVFGAYRPAVYGYNAAGRLVDTDVKGAVFTAPEGYAEAVDGGVLVTRAGCFALEAAVGDMKASIPVTVTDDVEAAPVSDSYLIDGTRRVAPALQALVGADYMPVANEAFAWQSSDTDVVTVDPVTGILTGISDGTAVVTATRGDKQLSVNVTVEIAPSASMPVDGDLGGEGWRVSKTSISDVTFTPAGENAWTLAFATTSSRKPQLTLRKAVKAYSLPDAVSVTVDPAGKQCSVGFGIKDAKARQATVVTSPDFTVPTTYTVDMADVFDASDVLSYPVELTLVQFSLAAESGVDHKLGVSDLSFRYNNFGASVDNVAVDGRNDRLPLVLDGTALSTTSGESIDLYTPSGVLVARGRTIDVSALRGLYIARAAHRAAKIIL